MWVARFTVTHEDSLTSPLTKKHKVTMLVFPLRTNMEKQNVLISTGHYIIGKEENKKAYFDEAIKNPRIIEYDLSGDLLIYSFRAPLKNTHLQTFFDPSIWFLKPVVVDSKGIQHFVMGSWKKENLTKVMNEMKPNCITFNLQSLKEEKINDLFIPHIGPPLSKKQKEVIRLAYSMGYYSYPKKTNLKKLAKKAKLSASALQEHLRKAEEKIIPFTMENLVENPVIEREKQE